MIEDALSRFLASAIMSPLIIPSVMVLIPHWRYSFRKILMMAILLESFLVLFSALVYSLLGATTLSIWVIGTLPPAICVISFIHCCDLRDQRVSFILSTLGLDIALCDVITSMFFSRNHVSWLALRAVVALIHTLLIWRFCRVPIHRMLNTNHIDWRYMSVIPLSLCIFLSGYNLYALKTGSGRTPALPTIFITVAVVLIYITLYRFQEATLAQAESKQSAALLNSEIDFLRKQTDLAQSSSERMRIFRHDMRHYISLLRGSLMSQRPEDTEKILQNMEQNTAEVSSRSALRRFTGDQLMDTVLSLADDQAQRLGVDFQVKLVLPEALRVDQTELAVVVSNALENAIRAAAHEPEGAPRQVIIQNLPCKQQLFLLISNSYSGTLDPDEKTGLPRASAQGHGYGTQSIFNFSVKYGCLLDCSLQDKVFRLRLLI